MSKTIVTRKINISELRTGMYVAQLEIPWNATSFPLEGVLVKDNDDIAKISRFSQSVYIDESKSLTVGMPKLLSSIADKPQYFKQNIKSNNTFRAWKKVCTHQYNVKKPIGQEMANAKIVLVKASQWLDAIKKDPNFESPKSIEALKQASDAIVNSVIENPDALIWVCRIQRTQKNIFNHTLRTSIWASMMARAMGLPDSDFRILVQSLLMSGVGKMALTKNDWLGCKIPKMQPNFARWTSVAVQRLAHSNIDSNVITTLINMNERVNGSGFPEGKKGRHIPYLAQIASLVETFDFIMRPMLSKSHRNVGQALSRLYCYRDTVFDGELIEAFINAIGLYPPGTQVELSNGARGIVVEHSVARRIRGTVALTHEAGGYRMFNYKVARMGEGKFKNVIIKKEINNDDINQDDMAQINQLIAKYQGGLLSRVSELISKVVSKQSA